MIRIAHAYHNLLNLYGSWANPAFLERYLNEAGYETEIIPFEVGEYIDLSSCDLIYFGAGTERKMLSALFDFRRYQRELKIYLKDEKRILATGNGMAILGGTITDVFGQVYQGTSVLDIQVTITNMRKYTELLLVTSLSEAEVIGNINSSLNIVHGNERALFEIKMSTSNIGRYEGFIKNGIYATEVTGPLLVRNPHLLHSFAEQMVEKELPQNTNGWYITAVEGYERAKAELKRDLKI